MDIIKYEKFNNIFAVDCFDKEFEQLFDSSSYKRYAEWLRRNLHNLDTRGKNAVDGSHIEKLYKDGFNLYSIRYPRSKTNPRVIFYFTTEDNYVILLCAILEKSSSDYTRAIRKAIVRIKEVD